MEANDIQDGAIFAPLIDQFENEGAANINYRDVKSPLQGRRDETEEDSYYGDDLDLYRLAGSQMNPSASTSHRYEAFHDSSRRTHSSRIPAKCFARLGYAVAVLTMLFLIIGLPYLFYNGFTDSKSGTFNFAFYSASAFVFLTIPISTYEIFMHLTHWYMPDVQKYVVRILWMVPLYSLQGYLSLRFPDWGLAIDTLRDLYEAYIIASFLYYLIELLGGEAHLAAQLAKKGESKHGEHHWTMNLMGFPNWSMGAEFVLQCKYGVLQYVVVRTLSTILTVVLELTGLYQEGLFAWNNGYVFISIVLNFSVSYALYVLVKFFYATKAELKEWNPMGKFLCVKGVVFFTWWQGVGIFILQHYKIIDDVGDMQAGDVGTLLQDYLVTFEMLIFAIAHTYTFTYKEYGGGGFTATDSDVDRDYVDKGDAYRRGDGDSVDWASVNSKQTSDSDNGVVLYDPAGRESAASAGYAPKLVRQLDEPLSFSQAFWSSTVPDETLSDIKRLSRGAASAQVLGNDRNKDVEFSIHNAESI